MATVDVTRIASNIQALNALNSLQGINAKLAMHQNRLATGKRINSAGDDPAGLTIATKMMARSEGLKASIDNISDARNMLSVAEGGLSTMTDIMIAMRSQAEKAASDTLGTAERATIQTQLSSYAQQIQDLVDQTKWNGVKLLDNTTGAKVFQTGVDEGETTTWTIPGKLDPGPTGLNLSKRVASATATSTGVASSFTAIAAGVPVQATSVAANLSELSTGDFSVTVKDIATSATLGKTILDTSSTLIGGMSALTNSLAQAATTTKTMTSGKYELKIISASALSVTYELKNLTDTSWAGGKLSSTTGWLAAAVHTSLELVDTSGTAATNLTLGVKLDFGGGGAAGLTTGQTMSFEYIRQNDVKFTLQDAIGQDLTVSQYKFDGLTSITTTAVSGYGLASYSQAQALVNLGRGIQVKSTAWGTVLPTVNGSIQNFTYEKASNFSVNVSNTNRAGAYLTTVTTALDRVTSALSDLGALMSRLSYKEEQSATAQVNIEGAYSRIMNANMAEEQVNASKYTILQQTATAMLAQANAAPQSLLALFR